MHMKKRSIAIIIAIAALAVAPLVMAAPGRMGRHGFGGPGPGGHGFAAGFGFLGHLRHAQEELDLSDQQVDQLKAIFTELHEQNAAYRDQMHDGLKAIADTLIANPNDVAAAQALLDAQFATERTMKTNMLNATSKALNVLTSEQRAKLSTLIEEHAQRRGRRGR
jgi:protein CpxP